MARLPTHRERVLAVVVTVLLLIWALLYTLNNIKH